MSFSAHSKLACRLESDGFSAVDRNLDKPTIQMLRTSFERLDEAHDSISELERGARNKRGITFARRNLLSAAFVQRFIASAPVVSLVNRISAGSIAVRAILFDKTGDANWTDRGIRIGRPL